MTLLRDVNLIIAFLATLAPMVHVMELANKLALDGPLWLAIQQGLYRGWGPLIGGPSEIAALLTTLVLLIARRGNAWPAALTLAASMCYVGMLAAFFAFNGPVNTAVSRLTPATLPTDWPTLRARWEMGHAIAAGFSLIAFAALFRVRMIEAEKR